MEQFYWIHIHHWYYGNEEVQFYKGKDEKELRKYLKEKLNKGWVVDCMKIMNS